MRRILLTVAYDGTKYNGWQKQIFPKVPTIEECLEGALRKLFQSPELTCLAASRTDKGVHALAQKVTIDVETEMPTERIPVAIIGLLPNDILVVKAEDVPDEFHPRYHCTKKTYEYCIINSHFRNPKERLYATFVYGILDIDQMNLGAKEFIGTKDFAAFCAEANKSANTTRTIFDCRVEKQGNKVCILVTGDGFLYNMVRIIAGTLIAVGRGKKLPSDIKDMIESKDRTKSGKTAEPQALTLQEIYYDFLLKTIDS